jgi:hypothetical protein
VRDAARLQRGDATDRIWKLTRQDRGTGRSLSTAAASQPKWKIWTGRVLSGLPLLAFLPSAAMKLMASPEFLEQWSKAYPASTARPIGAVELLCFVIYLIPRTRVLGAILLTGYLGGAVSTHVRAGEVAFIVPIIVGIMVWGGIFLRDSRLQALLPLTKDD